jgi:hypothetical protein
MDVVPITKAARRKRLISWTFPFVVAGWIIAASSLAGLVLKTGRVSIQGPVGGWLDTYVDAIDTLRFWLFGWIEVSWAGVSDWEAHFMVIAGLLCSSVAQGFAHGDEWPSPFARVLWMRGVAWAPWLVPDPWSLCALVLLLPFFLYAIPLSKELAYDRRVLTFNLLGVLGTAILIIVLGYILESHVDVTHRE